MTKSSSKPTDTSGTRRYALAGLLLPFAFFPLVALLTYDWRAIEALNTPATRSANWIGALGDTFAYYGYTFFGLAIWLVPAICVIAGLCLVTGRRVSPLRREVWFLVLLVSVAGLLQAFGHHAGWTANVTRRINIANTGGAVGYLMMTRFLSPLLSDFGASVLLLMVAFLSVVGAVGLHNIAAMGVGVYRWMTAGLTVEAADGADGVAARRPAAPADADADAQRAAYDAALRAKADAKRQREEERAAAKAEKLAAKEAKRQALQKAKDAVLAARHETPAPAAPPAASARGSSGAPARAVGRTDEPVEDKGPYVLPPAALLKPVTTSVADHGDVGETSQQLINTLKIFGVDAVLSYTVQGPVVTKYALELSPGTRYSSVTNISSELMGALHAKSLRIEAPIPGEDRIGIEVPNKRPAGISFREIFESEAWRNSKAELPLLFGKDAAGRELIADLASMPHMLVAGATGQGKSVCLNSLICGLLMTRTPDQLKLIMVDPKMVEFTPYAAIPHLIVPVITENKKVVFALHWAVAEMEKRLALFARARVKNIADFNRRKPLTQTDMFGNDTVVGSDLPQTVPYIVIIIDEAADLIGQCGKDVNPDIQRITQKARAAGIHLILATQRPDAKIITGTIKANIPGRVAFKTSSSVDSRTILDETGAENLIGKGDMLFRGKDNSLLRAQGAWITDEEIASVTSFIEQHCSTAFDSRFAAKLSTIKEEEVDLFGDDEAGGGSDDGASGAGASGVGVGAKPSEHEEDFKKAIQCIIDTKRASTSHFQRRLGWGYNHAAKIMDDLQDAGVIGPLQGAGTRPIIMDQPQLVAILNGDNQAAVDAVELPDESGDRPAEVDATLPQIERTEEQL